MILVTQLGAAADLSQIKANFKNPPREYSTGPLWVWNDMLTEREIIDTLHDLAGQKVKQVWVHPRPGLMTPYLSPDWFRMWKVALKEAARLDMNVWIYDENSYPSGFAGGFVPEVMPESRGRGLLFKETKTAPSWSSNLLAVFRLIDETAEDVTGKVRAGETLAEARYLSASVHRTENRPWNADRCYVDLMYPGVTEKFLDITLEAYRREVGSEFGKRIPGVFTDEPNIRPDGGLPWTDGLPEEFQKRWGYSLPENLPSLASTVGDWRKVRHNYYQVLLERFIERWAKPYHDYCAKHGLEMTGHYWEHEWPITTGVPDNMAMYAWQQRPAIDTLMNQYHEDTHAQFGNARAARELSSVANQLGLKRTLCEVYGAGGWDLRLEDMKRIGDWLQVLGVNTLCQHLSYVTIRGARKRDHPQSFSYHEPWWSAYHISAEYLARLSAALSSGEQLNTILVLEPTTTAWMYQNHSQLDKLGDSFQRLVLKLEAAQIEYDMGSEDILAHHGSVSSSSSFSSSSSSAKLTVGKRTYDLVVIPPMTENLNASTMSLLEQLLAKGGRVLCCGEPPSRIDGSVSDRAPTAAINSHWEKIETTALPTLLHDQQCADGFAITRNDGDKGILFHHRRRLAEGDLLFLANTSIESPSAGVIQAKGSIENWDLETGKIAPYNGAQSSSSARSFNLPPCGSLLLFLQPYAPSASAAKNSSLTQAAEVSISPVSPLETRRLEPNVLLLDYVDITAAGQTRTNQYFYPANQFAFKQNGMDRDPWDSAVQFRDEIIKKTFPAESGFEATYHFTIEDKVPSDLSIVIERPDLYSITCNGLPVAWDTKHWWLDKSFGRLEISKAARVGENTVTLKASPFTIYHELESAYVLGNFALRPSENGFVVTPTTPLQLGAWNAQGHPFYSAGAAYSQKFKLDRVSGRCFVSLPKWYGSVAKVTVNGKEVGWIACQPWECEVTDRLRRGTNTIEVTVIGTLKNTLGPHHGKPALGAAWPNAFQKGPNPGPPAGSEYSTVAYGLLAPFELRVR